MPISPVVIGYVLAVGAGVSFVFQQAVNANLRGELGSIWWAGFVSYLGGTLVMLVVALALREPWFSTREVLQRTHLISWSGRIFGAIYIAVSILLIPRPAGKAGVGTHRAHRGGPDAWLTGVRSFWIVGCSDAPGDSPAIVGCSTPRRRRSASSAIAKQTLQ